MAQLQTSRVLIQTAFPRRSRSSSNLSYMTIAAIACWRSLAFTLWAATPAHWVAEPGPKPRVDLGVCR